MENKKNIEEIRKEITSLEEQEFELKYGLSKNQYFSLKHKLNSDFDKDKEDRRWREKMLNPYGFNKSSTDIKMDIVNLDIDRLKNDTKSLLKITNWHSISIILLSITLILSILF